VILSGGVSSQDDIRSAAASGMAGVIVGRALYEGRLTLADALAACRQAR
jgi:phosphoribosylformimino-5-aminoimidazole carboxamide ribotide isomerase